MKFTLDVNKWRCGSSSMEPSNRKGEGKTRMLNTEGYMCCLGQFALQEGCTPAEILDTQTPSGVNRFYSKIFQNPNENNFGNSISVLSGDLMHINDSPGMKVSTKIRNIRKILKQEDHTLRVINLKGESHAK